MSRIYASALIRQPIELVFNYVTTPGNWPRWHLSSLAVSGATNHSLNVGEQVTEEFLVAGRLGRAVWTVTERDEPRRWVIDGEVIGGDHGGRVIYSLSEHGESATLFEREFFYDFPNPIQRLVDRLFIRSRITRESVDSMNRLRERLEELGATLADALESD